MLDMTFGDADSVAAKDRAAARRYRHAGTGLIVLAVVLPWFVRTVSGPYEAGRLLGETVGALLMLMLVAWLLTLKGSELAKGRARLAVGVLLCLMVIGSETQDRQKREEARRFLNDALALQAENKMVFEGIEKRFEALKLGQYTTPQALASSRSLAAGRAALAQFRALLQERQSSLQRYLVRYRAFLDGIPSGDFRRGAEASWAQSSEAAKKLYADLDTAQFAVADAMDALFEWMQANNRKLSLNDGKLMFQTEAQRTAALSLAHRLDETVAHALQLEQAAEAAQVQAAARQQQVLKEAEAFLGR